MLNKKLEKLESLLSRADIHQLKLIQVHIAKKSTERLFATSELVQQ